MKNISKYILGIAAIGLMSSCIDKFEDFNTNPYRPSTLPASTLLPTMFECYASPQQNSCQGNNTMWACFSGQVTAPTTWNNGRQTFAYFNAMESYNESTVNDFFTKIYSNLFRIEELTGKRGTIYSIAQLTRIYAMHIIASLQGPLPYSQIAAGKTAVAYDDEPTAWHAMFDDLNDVITTLKVAAKDGVNNELADIDQFYKGDCTKWLKFANTLKLRMAMRISGKEPEFAQQMAEEAVRDGVMTSIEDSAYDTTNSGQSNNGYKIIDGWGEVRANACIVSYMNGYQDPRLSAYFTEQKNDATGGYIGVRSGSNEIPDPASYTNYSRLFIATDQTLPQPVMYAAEAAFLRAEGALKNWNMGGEAGDLYNEGIRLSFQESKVSGVEDYLVNATNKPADYKDQWHGGNDYQNPSKITIKWDENATDEEKLERILTQKWIACYLDPMNGWADFRRTGYPRIFPPVQSYDSSCDLNRQQRRARFSQKEYNTNTANVEAACAFLSNGQDSNGTDLWWAKKTNGSY